MDSDYPSVGTKDFASYWYWKHLEPDKREKFEHGTFVAGYDAAMDNVRPLLEKLANEAWMRQDFATNAAICKLQAAG